MLYAHYSSLDYTLTWQQVIVSWSWRQQLVTYRMAQNLCENAESRSEGGVFVRVGIPGGQIWPWDLVYRWSLQSSIQHPPQPLTLPSMHPPLAPMSHHYCITSNSFTPAQTSSKSSCLLLFHLHGVLYNMFKINLFSFILNISSDTLHIFLLICTIHTYPCSLLLPTLCTTI